MVAAVAATAVVAATLEAGVTANAALEAGETAAEAAWLRLFTPAALLGDDEESPEVTV